MDVKAEKANERCASIIVHHVAVRQHADNVG